MTQDLTRVYATTDQFAGELMRGRLEAEGIQVLLKGEIEGPYPSGPVYLWVAASDEARARAVIDAVGSGAFAVTDDDPVDQVDRDGADELETPG